MFIAYTYTHQCTRTHIPPSHGVQAKPQSHRSYETWAAWQNSDHFLSPYLSRQCAGQEVRQVTESVTQDEQSAMPTLVTAHTLWFIVLNASESYLNTFSISKPTRDSSTHKWTLSHCSPGASVLLCSIFKNRTALHEKQHWHCNFAGRWCAKATTSNRSSLLSLP